MCTCACEGEGEGQIAGIWAEVCDKPPLNLTSLPFIPQLCDLEHTGNLSEPLSIWFTTPLPSPVWPCMVLLGVGDGFLVHFLSPSLSVITTEQGIGFCICHGSKALPCPPHLGRSSATCLRVLRFPAPHSVLGLVLSLVWLSWSPARRSHHRRREAVKASLTGSTPGDL